MKQHEPIIEPVDETELLPIPHPGETLKEDFMEPLGLTAYAVAKALGVPQIAISQIIRGKRAVSPEMALRLGHYTRTGPEFWHGLQAEYDLRIAQREKDAEIAAFVIPLAIAA